MVLLLSGTVSAAKLAQGPAWSGLMALVEVKTQRPGPAFYRLKSRPALSRTC